MPSTFGQLADRMLQDLMHIEIQCRCLRVDFVCDQYPVQNIKNCERERHAMGGTQVIHIIRPDQLEKDVEPLAQFPAGSDLIVDGMAFIHQIHTMPSTFGQLADRRLQDLMHMAIQCICLRVDLVCDQYTVQSIKNCERQRRAMGGTQVIHITRSDQKTPKQFKKYLANGRNKEFLIEFPFQCWTTCDSGILGNVLLVVSHGEVCHSIDV